MIKQIPLFPFGYSRGVRDSLGGKQNPARMTSGVLRERHLTLGRLDLSNRPFRDHGRFAFGNQSVFRVEPGGSITPQIETKTPKLVETKIIC